MVKGVSNQNSREVLLDAFIKEGHGSLLNTRTALRDTLGSQRLFSDESCVVSDFAPSKTKGGC